MKQCTCGRMVTLEGQHHRFGWHVDIRNGLMCRRTGEPQEAK